MVFVKMWTAISGLLQTRASFVLTEIFSKIIIIKNGFLSRVFTRIYQRKNGEFLVIGEYPRLVYTFNNGKAGILKQSEKFNIAGNNSRFAYNRLLSFTNMENYLVEITDSTIQALTSKKSFIEAKSFIHWDSTQIIALEGRSLSIYSIDSNLCEPWNNQLIPEEIAAIDESLNNKKFILSKHHLYSITPGMNLKQIASHDLNPFREPICHIQEDMSGRIWLAGCNSNLYVFDPEINKFWDASKVLNLGNTQVLYLFCDRKGNMWISTSGQGLICILNGEFKKIPLPDNSNYITSIVQDSNIIWATTNFGFHKMEYQTNPNTLKKKWLIETRITNSYVQYIYKYAPHTYVYNNAYGIEQKLGRDLFHSAPGVNFHKATDGYLYCAFWSSIRKYVIKPNGGIKVLPKDQRNIVLSSGEKALKIFTHKGQLYALTNKRLGLIVASTFKELDLPYQLLQNQEFYELNDITIDKNNKLWLATSLGVFEETTRNNWKRYTSSDGLSTDKCLSLAVDDANSIWIGTSSGLNVFKQGEFIIYNESNGLPSDKISSVLFDSIHQLILVGTPKGLVYHEAGELKKKDNKTYS